MKSPKRLLEVSFLLMALLSGLLLTASLGSPSYLLIGGLGALAGFILVDWTGWIRIPTSVANVLSFVVLYVSMRGFFSNETSGQLGSVANLLIYLQTLLVLQEKGPRQYWQLMVLSFLQLVVASVFHVQLEGGVLFLAYMATTAIFLVLLNSYSQSWQNPSRKTPSPERTGRGGPSGSWSGRIAPEIVLDFAPSRFASISNMMRHVIAWIMACVAFASVLFVLIPRSDVSWFTGRSSQAVMPGSANQVNLDERGQIKLNYATVLKARFRAGRRTEGIQLANPAYFRTMAFGSLVVENGNSTWKAPYDRVYQWQPVFRPVYPGDAVLVQITREPSTDPVMTTIEPVFDNPDQAVFGYYSNDLALIARSDMDGDIELMPYSYQFRVPLMPNGDLPDSYPYQYLDTSGRNFSMRDSPAEYQWLTSLDRDRFSGIAAIGDSLRQELGTDDERLIAKRLERWFLEAGRFTYTLDYSNVPRQENLDSVEDFVVNHRQGHCEMFASALAVMLRSQGIPARMAIGFYGGSYLNDQGEYQVTGGHAHAWVEAYIAPEFCTEEMIRRGVASQGGAWLRLDATPSSDLRDQFANASDAINLARNLWQDYVLGMEAGKQPTWGAVATSVIAGALDLSVWSGGMQSAMQDIQARPGTYLVAFGITLLVIGLVAIALFRKPAGNGDPGSARSPLARLRKVLGNTLGVLAPGLGRWVRGEQSNRVWFFDRLTGILAREGIVRTPTITYQEFADQAAERLSTGHQDPEIRSVIQNVIDRFQQVRFGGVELDTIERPGMEARLLQLTESLRIQSRKSANPDT